MPIRITLTVNAVEFALLTESLMWMRMGLEERLAANRANRGGHPVKMDRNWETRANSCTKLLHKIQDQEAIQ